MHHKLPFSGVVDVPLHVPSDSAWPLRVGLYSVSNLNLPLSGDVDLPLDQPGHLVLNSQSNNLSLEISICHFTGG